MGNPTCDLFLSRLCMISAYREKDIDWEKVVNTFALENPRKMVLINIFEEKEKDD